MASQEEDHISSFIDAFVASGHRSGWRSALLERPGKARSRLGRAERQLDARFCTLVDDPETPLRSLAGPTRVVYFDGMEAPHVLTPELAITQWRHRVSDALVSIVAGQEAVLLFHEGWGWVCQRKRPAV